jgi:predicted  nucleic acid-binding Zn-ribbon protein
MANKTNEISVEEKLRALYDLQIIDSRLDEIRNTRGELPIEVEDLEVEVEGLNKRASKFDNEIKDLQNEIAAKKKQSLILSL